MRGGANLRRWWMCIHSACCVPVARTSRCNSKELQAPKDLKLMCSYAKKQDIGSSCKFVYAFTNSSFSTPYRPYQERLPVRTGNLASFLGSHRSSRLSTMEHYREGFLYPAALHGENRTRLGSVSKRTLEVVKDRFHLVSREKTRPVAFVLRPFSCRGLSQGAGPSYPTPLELSNLYIGGHHIEPCYALTSHIQKLLRMYPFTTVPELLACGTSTRRTCSRRPCQKEFENYPSQSTRLERENASCGRRYLGCSSHFRPA